MRPRPRLLLRYVVKLVCLFLKTSRLVQSSISTSSIEEIGACSSVEELTLIELYRRSRLPRPRLRTRTRPTPTKPLLRSHPTRLPPRRSLLRRRPKRRKRRRKRKMTRKRLLTPRRLSRKVRLHSYFHSQNHFGNTNRPYREANSFPHHRVQELGPMRPRKASLRRVRRARPPAGERGWSQGGLRRGVYVSSFPLALFGGKKK